MEHFQIRLFKPGFSRIVCAFKNAMIEDHSSSVHGHRIASNENIAWPAKIKKPRPLFPYFGEIAFVALFNNV